MIHTNLRLALTMETACYTAFPTTVLPNSTKRCCPAHNQYEETRPHHCCFNRSSLASDQTAARVPTVIVDVLKHFYSNIFNIYYLSTILLFIYFYIVI